MKDLGEDFGVGGGGVPEELGDQRGGPVDFAREVSRDVQDLAVLGGVRLGGDLICLLAILCPEGLEVMPCRLHEAYVILDGLRGGVPQHVWTSRMNKALPFHHHLALEDQPHPLALRKEPFSEGEVVFGVGHGVSEIGEATAVLPKDAEVGMRLGDDLQLVSHISHVELWNHLNAFHAVNGFF